MDDLETLPRLIRKTAAEKPEKPMFIGASGAVNYDQFLKRSALLKVHLDSLGIGAGDRVAVRIADKMEFSTVLFGLLDCGIVAVPLDTAVASAQQWLIADSGCRLFIGDEESESGDGFEILISSQIGAGLTASEEWVGAHADDIGLMLYTSGTEGVRKGVQLSHRNIVSVAEWVNDYMKVDDSIREFVTSPIDHAFGFGRCRTVLAAGGTVVLENGAFNPLAFFAILEAQGCNACSGVSTTFGILADRFGDRLAAVNGRLRWLKMGSIGLNVDSKKRLASALPDTAIFQNYGLTEAQTHDAVELPR